MFILPQSAPPAAGGGAPWSIAGSWTYSTAVANVDFTNLGSYNELMVIARGVTASASGFRVVQCSTDNGASFRSTNGDYVVLYPDGHETLTTGVSIQSGAVSTGVSGILRMPNSGLNGAPKAMIPDNAFNGSTGPYPCLFVQSTSPVNALRVVSVASSGNLNGGTIQVLGR